MPKVRLLTFAFVFVMLRSSAGAPQVPPDTPAVGWRGNWTGRYPDARPPLTWSRRSTSPIDELRYSANKPPGADAMGALVPSTQSIVNWLVIGPFMPKDAKTALDEAFIPDEAAVAPAEGEKAAGHAWTLYSKASLEEQWQRIGKGTHWDGAFDDDAFDGVNFEDVFPGSAKGVCYAHAYLFSPRAGAVALMVNHQGGMKVWLNGAPIYTHTDPVIAGPVYWHDWVTKFVWHFGTTQTIRLDLSKGWNRVLFKIAAGEKTRFDLRITAPSDAGYESKNILWETPLPSHGLCNPIVVGDKIFLTQELDDLTCIDKKSGKILWRRATTFFDATPPEVRSADPRFKPAESIAAAIQECASYLDNLQLHRQLQEILTKIDPVKYAWPAPHAAQGPTVGYATPNVCSDGKSIYVYYFSGVVASYDLEGNRRWAQLITDVPPGFPNASPAIAGDKFVVQRTSVMAFDKVTGKRVWTTPLEDARCGGTVPAKVGGEDVVIVNFDRVLRCSDGKIISGRKTVHHSTPVVTEDNTVVSCADANLGRWRMESIVGDELKVKFLLGAAPGIRNADDIASPLYDNGFVYMMDGKGRLVVWRVNEAEPKVAYNKSLGLDPMHVLWDDLEHGCCASPMLGGKNVYLMDNQGTTVVIEPGGAYKPISVNKIENFLPRRLITNTQEHFYASPICDGNHLLLRGEETLYCIGEP